MQCPDFDFCEACRRDHVYQHPDHRFMQIKTSQHTFNSDGSTSTSTNANLNISERVASPVPSSSRVGGVERQGVPLPQRNRYSSTFGHRYTGSVGITTGIPASMSDISAGVPGSGGGDSEQGDAITVEGRAAPASTSSTRDWSLGRSQERKFKVCIYVTRNHCGHLLLRSYTDRMPIYSSESSSVVLCRRHGLFFLFSSSHCGLSS